MDYKIELMNLLRLSKLVREKQKQYFRSRNMQALEACKKQESILDEKINALSAELSVQPQQNLFDQERNIPTVTSGFMDYKNNEQPLSEKAKDRIANAIKSENVENFLSTEERNKRRADAQAKYITDRNNIIDGNQPETINP